MKTKVLRLLCLTIPLALGGLGAAGFLAIKYEAYKPEPPLSYRPSTVEDRPSTVEEWANQVTKAKGDKVYIEIGDRAGGGGSDNDARLSIALLSPILKQYRQATTFTVSWDYTVAMGTDSFELVYERKQSRMTFKENWRKSPAKVQRFAKVTDAMIHAAAAKGDSFANINSYQ